MISIRHARPEDADALHQIISGPRVIWGTFVMPYMSLQQTQTTLASLPEGMYWLVAWVPDAVVGSASLSINANPRRRHVGTVAMAVRDDWQSKGVGTALMGAVVDLADNWLNLARLELQTWTDNAAAIALYRKFGFVVEGTHQAYVFRDGEYVDALGMARVRV